MASGRAPFRREALTRLRCGRSIGAWRLRFPVGDVGVCYCLGRLLSINFSGLANHQLEIDDELARRSGGMGNAVEHGEQRCGTNFESGLANGGQGRLKQLRIFDVVDAGDAKLPGNLDSEAADGPEQLRGGEVVGANDGVRVRLLKKLLDRRDVAGVDPFDEGFGGCSEVGMQRLLVAADTGVNSVG